MQRTVENERRLNIRQPSLERDLSVNQALTAWLCQAAANCPLNQVVRLLQLATGPSSCQLCGLTGLLQFHYHSRTMACRMFGYCGKSEADVHALFSGLKRACANDPTLQSVAEGCSRHCHGWGYVIYADNGLFHYRTSHSIYEDQVVLPKLEGCIRAIFHGRYAGDPELAGHIFSHPFMAANNGEVIYFAHNGGVEPDRPLNRTVDSEWALEEITRAGGIAAALPKLKVHTRSALNLLTLTISRAPHTPASLQYFHFFKPTDPDKAAYYRMYLGTMPGGRAVVSSTLTLEDANVTELKKIRPAEFDVLTALD